MSDDMKYLLFYGALWVAGIGAWLWIRWRLAKDAAAEKAARDAWALVTPRDGCTRTIPGCICARDNLGPWCVWRRPTARRPTLTLSRGQRRSRTRPERSEITRRWASAPTAC